MISAIVMLFGFWAILTGTLLFVFGDDIAESERCGQIARASLQVAAVVGAFPLIIGTAWLTALMLS